MYSILRPITAGMIPTGPAPVDALGPHAFVIRSRLSRWIPTVIGLTQEMVDAKIAELRAELEATE
jgi:hypothetical protein